MMLFFKHIKKLKDIYINDLHVVRTFFRRDLHQRTIDTSWKSKPTEVSDDCFQSWFDTSQSKEKTAAQAEADFHNFILKDVHLSEKQVCCEIGFGGGRLLAESALLFKKAYGIDIHDAFDRTYAYLAEIGIENVTLYSQDQCNRLPEVDFFYSTIVIQHFKNIGVLEEYLALIKSKLSPDGVAVLGYGKLETKIFGDYVEINPRKFRERECSLYITPSKMEALLQKYGFKATSHSKRNYKGGDKANGYSMQAKIVFGHE